MEKKLDWLEEEIETKYRKKTIKIKENILNDLKIISKNEDQTEQKLINNILEKAISNYKEIKGFKKIAKNTNTNSEKDKDKYIYFEQDNIFFRKDAKNGKEIKITEKTYKKNTTK